MRELRLWGRCSQREVGARRKAAPACDRSPNIHAQQSTRRTANQPAALLSPCIPMRRISKYRSPPSCMSRVCLSGQELRHDRFDPPLPCHLPWGICERERTPGEPGSSRMGVIIQEVGGIGRSALIEISRSRSGAAKGATKANQPRPIHGRCVRCASRSAAGECATNMIAGQTPHRGSGRKWRCRSLKGTCGGRKEVRGLSGRRE